MTPDVNVVLLDFPNLGNEMVTENEDGSFTVLINARLAYKGQLAAYQHAMKHIINDDFERDNVQTIEAVAHAAEKKEVEPLPSDRFSNCLKTLRARRKRVEKALAQAEAVAEFKQSMRRDDGWSLSDSQQWYGSEP